MAKKGLYKGYSSFEFQRAGTFKVNDIECVKIDLLNHIFTRKGDRVRMPTFGTSIPDLVFEPLDEETIDNLHEELTTVFDYDPRVTLISLTVTPYYDENRVVASAQLYYVELNLTEGMDINIEFEGQL